MSSGVAWLHVAMHLQAALRDFLVQLQADGHSPHTIGQYRRHGRALANWLGETQRELFSVSIDPRTNREPKRGFLPEGTLIADPARILANAKAQGLELVVVRVVDHAGCVSLERVDREALARALPMAT